MSIQRLFPLGSGAEGYGTQGVNFSVPGTNGLEAPAYSHIQVENQMKISYLPVLKDRLLNSPNELYRIIGQKEGLNWSGIGLNANVKVGVSNATASTGDSGKGIGKHKSGGTKNRNFFIRAKNVVWTTSVEYKAEVNTRSTAAAFRSEAESQLDSMAKDTADFISVIMYGEGKYNGIAKATADVTPTVQKTLEVAVDEGYRFEIGAGITAVNVNSAGSATVITGLENLVVDNVERNVTSATDSISGFKITFVKADGSNFAVTELIKEATTKFVRRITPTDGNWQVDDIQPTSVLFQLKAKKGDVIHNVERDYLFSAPKSTLTTPSVLTSDLLRSIKDEAERRGSEASVMIANHDVISGYESSLSSNARFIPSTVLAGGYRVLTHDSDTFIKDKQAPAGALLGINSSSFKKYVNVSPTFSDYSGSMWNQSPDNFSKKCDGFMAYDIVCENPQKNFFIDGLKTNTFGKFNWT